MESRSSSRLSGRSKPSSMRWKRLRKWKSMFTIIRRYDEHQQLTGVILLQPSNDRGYADWPQIRRTLDWAKHEQQLAY